MRIAVPHRTTKALARTRVEQKIDQLMSQFGGHAEDVTHDWAGDTLHFKGKARGFSISGTVDITDSEVIIDSKLPFMASMFEGRIRHAVEREAETMFA
ncbi:MAG TPA: polyhydroxyalkanoic acid system family protein [Thermoanaerobaculia bacterium]